MKKFTIAVATVLASGGLNACTSDYVCTCDVTVFGFPVSVDTTFTDVSRGDAEDECQALEDETNEGSGGLATASCEAEKA